MRMAIFCISPRSIFPLTAVGRTREVKGDRMVVWRGQAGWKTTQSLNISHFLSARLRKSQQSRQMTIRTVLPSWDKRIFLRKTLFPRVYLLLTNQSSVRWPLFLGLQREKKTGAKPSAASVNKALTLVLVDIFDNERGALPHMWGTDELIHMKDQQWSKPPKFLFMTTHLRIIKIASHGRRNELCSTHFPQYSFPAGNGFTRSLA